MNIIGKRKIFLGFSGGLVLISLFLVAFLGLKQGIDLKGGTQWQVEFENQSVNEDSIKSVFAEEASDLEILVKRASDGSFIIRLADIDEARHQSYLSALKTLGDVKEKSFASIGPAIGSELRRRAVWAIIAALLAISIYIAWVFRKVSKPIKSWKYGVVTLVTLFHDVVIPTGLLAVLGVWKGIEIDTNFIVALLVVMGFSVHDTIVVFDRIRENLLVNKGRNIPLRDIINYSVKETF
ncbi:MAG: protein translocase subunit SecF, partial [Patescibacteria group bacterium]